MNLLVSACLLGVPCRYDRKSKHNEAVIRLKEKHKLIPVCPEVLGGLSIPHPASERLGEKVVSKDGSDVTKAFLLGAEKVLALAKKHNCSYAVLKEKSPSCGKGRIYDGTFSKTLVPGNGVTAALLMENGIIVLGESEIDVLM